jgi:molybdopterin molybdotransferase
MSVGSEDHLTRIIRRRGSLDVWRLAVKPGKPVGLGDVDGCPVLGLPGNPVAAMVLFLVLGRPLVLRLAGTAEPAGTRLRLPAGFAWSKKSGRREFLLGRTVTGEGRGSVAVPLPKQGSAMLTAAAGAEGLIDLPEDVEAVREGDVLDYLPLVALLG